MSIQISICKETATGEHRVAATPETVKKMVNAGLSVCVQKGAGLASSYTDEAYKNAGASIGADAPKTLKNADIVLCVQMPEDAHLKNMKKSAILIGALAPHNISKTTAQNLKSQKLSAMAMELMPRITRAQSMDILSSQANLAGYRAVIDATHEFGRAFPMMMTAAGTISPARVFVMGAGVAGLQAIATAKRLGAVVSATDVRLAAKEQVESLGGTFVMVENEETQAAETGGGYAKEMSAAYKKEQAKLVADTIAKQDIVITTALIPGKPAPELVTEDMVKSMKPGSVIVDLATAQGGNCAISEAGKIVEKHGVKIIGFDNMASRIAVDASALYARNLWTFLQTIITDQDDKKALHINTEDEIIASIMIAHDGEILNDNIEAKKAASKSASKPSAKPLAKKAGAKSTAQKTTKKAPAKKAGTAKASTTKKEAPKKASKKASVAKPKKTTAKKATSKTTKTTNKTTKTTKKKA